MRNLLLTLLLSQNVHALDKENMRELQIFTVAIVKRVGVTAPEALLEQMNNNTSFISAVNNMNLNYAIAHETPWKIGVDLCKERSKLCTH